MTALRENHALGCTCSTGCQACTKLEALGITPDKLAEPETDAPKVGESKKLSPPTLTRAEYLRRRANGGS